MRWAALALAAAAACTPAPAGEDGRGGTARPSPAAECPATPSEGEATFPPTPERASVGTAYAASGRVRSTRGCAALAGARVEFWLAGPDGEYGEAHRGWTLTGPDGSYRITTTFPGRYGGADPHIHFRFSHREHREVVATVRLRSGDREGSLDVVLAAR